MSSDSSVEEFTLCIVCRDQYNENTRSPRVLNCGHVVCTSCLNGIQTSQNKNCPECRSYLAPTSPFPVCYALLRLSHNRPSLVPGIPKEKESKDERDIKLYSRWYEDLVERLENKKIEISSWKTLITQKLNTSASYDVELKSIEEALRKTTLDNSADAKKFKKSLKKLSSDFYNLASNLSLVDSYFLMTTPNNLYSKLIKKFDFQKMKDDGNIYYACLEANGQRRFSKISFGENVAYLHVVKDDLPPSGAILIDYQVVRPMSQPSGINFNNEQSKADIFIEFTMGEIVKTVHFSLQSNLLAHQSALLCSGERGPTYKGAKVQRRHFHLLVDHYVKRDGLKASDDILTGILDDNHITQKMEKGLLIGSRSMNIGATFTISTSQNASMDTTNVIGKVTGGMSVIQNFSFRGGVITDCGLVLRV